MKKLLSKLMKNPGVSLLNAMALMAVIQSVASTCTWYAYQPEVPESARKFAKER